MTSNKQKVLFVLGGGAAALALAAAIFALTFDINSYRLRIEAAASEATGLEVRIKGKMGLSLFPFGLSAVDIRVASKGDEILSLESLRLGAKFMSLLNKQLKVTSCELVKPAGTIVRDAEGNYNFEGPEEKKSAEGRPAAAFSLKELKLSKGVLVYLDKKTGERTEFKDLNLAVKDLSIAGDAIKSASFTGSFDCKEVLQKDFRIENLKSSVRAVKGIYNFEPLTMGALVYSDSKASEKTELKGINLAIRDLSVVGTSGALAKNIAFTGSLDCREIRRKDLKINNVKSPVKAEKGVIHLMPLTMDIFGAGAEGDATADKTEADAVYKINVKISKLDFGRLQESFGANKVIGGKGDLYASLTIKEGSRKLMSSLDGNFSLRGDDLVMHTMDLDKVLTSYETSQKFNLIDLGAFFIAGPFSAVAIKGYRYGDVYNQTQGGQGAITQFISHWKINNGVAEAADCGLATRHNRIALKGKLDLVGEQYENVIVALLDDKGCAIFKQGISGPFGSPRIGAVSAVESLAGPIANLFRKAKRFMRGGKCEVFYDGAVRQPPN